jgi:ASC-1-like (ASCH) protein
MAFRGPIPFGKSSSDKEEPQLSEHESELLDKLAKKVVHWKMSVPAIVALESVKPLNYIGSQAMVFFEPMVQALFNFRDYDTFRSMMERRETIELLLQRIEHFDAIAARKEKLFKKLRRAYLKKQTFWYRTKSAIIGFKVPEHLREDWKAQLDALDEPMEKSKGEQKDSEG